jgi:hypothetical protein
MFLIRGVLRRRERLRRKQEEDLLLLQIRQNKNAEDTPKEDSR